MSIDLDAIKARRTAYETAFEAKTQGKEWCDPVAFAAIDCTDDVPALVAEVERLMAWNGQAQIELDADHAEIGRLSAIIQAVEKLHRTDGYARPTCVGCGRYWPCPTVVNVAAAALSSLVSLLEPSGGSV